MTADASVPSPDLAPVPASCPGGGEWGSPAVCQGGWGCKAPSAGCHEVWNATAGMFPVLKLYPLLVNSEALGVNLDIS